MRNVGALILAAGGSTRFGEPKQFLQFEGETLLRRIAKAAHEAGCAPIVVVAGDSADRVIAELHDLPVHVVQNAEWRRGTWCHVLFKKGDQSCAFEIRYDRHTDASRSAAPFLHSHKDQCSFSALKLATAPQAGLSASNPALVDFHFTP
jgi:hypothetical protein